jgi:hypothetical protein
LIRVKSDIRLLRIGPYAEDGSYPTRLSGGGTTLTMRVVEYHVLLDGATTPELSGRTGAPCQDCSWGFPRPARRTRRATLTAPGAPRVLPVGQPLAAAAGFGVHGVGILLPR